MIKLKDIDETVIDIDRIAKIDTRKVDQDTHGLIFGFNDHTVTICRYSKWSDLLVDAERLRDYFDNILKA